MDGVVAVRSEPVEVLARFSAEGVLTIHAEGDVVQLRVNGLLLWHGSLAAWSRAVASPKKLISSGPRAA